MTDGDRLILAQFRERDIGQVRFEAKATFLAVCAGLVAGFCGSGLSMRATEMHRSGRSSWPPRWAQHLACRKICFVPGSD
jgi:hypothetical protein